MREGTARRGQRAVGAARKGRKELAGHGVLGLVFPGPSPQGKWDPPRGGYKAGGLGSIRRAQESVLGYDSDGLAFGSSPDVAEEGGRGDEAGVRLGCRGVRRCWRGMSQRSALGCPQGYQNLCRERKGLSEMGVGRAGP